MTKRADSIKYIIGGRGSDNLKGSAGKDVIVGRAGDDAIQGGAGKDVLYGDDIFGGKFWGCKFGGWWHGWGAGNDLLDGGAGSDLVFGGRGNDVVQYSMAGNLGAGFANVGAHDVYDGGKGNDVLKLQLTYGEAGLASVQQDIAAFEAFLARYANSHSDHGKTFHFKSFDLDARNFESLQIEKVNNAPAARNDAVPTDEDTPLSISPASLLANDSDADHLDVIAVVGADAQSDLGAAITVGPDGTLGYDPSNPSNALKLQQLAEGETVVDCFNYTIADLGGATASATVRVTVTGVNDLPTALPDAVRVPVTSSGGQPSVWEITFEGADNPDNGPPIVKGFYFEGFTIDPDGFGLESPTMAAARTTYNNAGGDGDADGAIRFGGEGQEFALLSLSIASIAVEPNVIIQGYRDGNALADAKLSLTLSAGDYLTHSFGPTWGSIDELRFYGHTDDVPVDLIRIDNLQVATGAGGGGGAPQAAAVDINVLANDKDMDRGDILKLLAFEDTSEMGAAISKNADGSLHYDPSGMDLPPLAPGETRIDTFEYTVSDAHGGTSVASVSVELFGSEAQDLLLASSAPDADLFF
jgi:VCBS repeat-containing protein